MSSLKASVLNCITSSPDDDQFIHNLDRLASKKGDATYQEMFHILVNQNFKSDQAKKNWLKIIAHRNEISTVLDRKISLITTISDFFGSMQNSLDNYKLVGIDTFEKVVEESTHDKLTGLFNRTYLNDALDQHLSLAKRHDTELSLLFLDIDDFKEINDTLGHHSGDIILRSVARTIEEGMRESDIKTRFGGDEFVILMPNTNKINALLLAERLRNEIKKMIIPINDKNHQVTVSGGVAGFPVDAQKSKNLLNLADSALYRAKGAGKNSISLFKEDKRRFLRIKFNRAIKVKQLGFSNTRTQEGMSKDIAIGGILFENKEALDIGIKVQLSIPIDKSEAPLLLLGTIVRVEALGKDNYDIGMILSFKEMEKTAKDEISKFLIQRLKAPI